MYGTVLSDQWLISELERVGWQTHNGEKTITTTDQQNDHRLVEAPFLTPAGRPATARILHGYDEGVQFWIRIFGSLSDVPTALRWLKPRPVRMAEAKGTPVVRQGDWFFIKMSRFSPGVIIDDAAYGRHIIQHWSRGCAKGRVTHCQHTSIFLDGWHRPCRCRGWHALSVAAPLHNQKYWVERINQGIKTHA